MAKSGKYIYLIVTVIITALIFAHSLMPAETSAEESGGILELVNTFFAFFHIPPISEYAVRKLAHFTEFAFFGAFLSRTVYEYSGGFKGQLFKILFFLLCVPVTDETLQLFTSGRSSQVSDILLDFAGALSGALIAFLFVFAVSHRKSKEASV